MTSIRHHKLDRPLRRILTELNETLTDSLKKSEPNHPFLLLMNKVWGPLQQLEEEADSYEHLKKDLHGNPFQVLEAYLMPYIKEDVQAVEMIKGCIILLNKIIHLFADRLRVHMTPGTFGLAAVITKQVELGKVEPPMPLEEEGEEGEL